MIIFLTLFFFSALTVSSGKRATRGPSHSGWFFSSVNAHQPMRRSHFVISAPYQNQKRATDRMVFLVFRGCRGYVCGVVVLPTPCVLLNENHTTRGKRGWRLDPFSQGHVFSHERLHTMHCYRSIAVDAASKKWALCGFWSASHWRCRYCAVGRWGKYVTFK